MLRIHVHLVRKLIWRIHGRCLQSRGLLVLIVVLLTVASSTVSVQVFVSASAWNTYIFPDTMTVLITQFKLLVLRIITVAGY